MTGLVRVNDAHTHFHNVLDIPIEGILETHLGFSESAACELADILKRAASFPSTVNCPPELQSEVLADSPSTVEGVWPSPRASLSWLRLMTFTPQALLDHYQANVLSADRIMFHLVDLDGFYRGAAAKGVDERHRNFGEFVAANPKLVGFVGYNPLTYDSLDQVKVMRSKFGQRVGVKFYPPSGYRPVGNDKSSVPQGHDPQLIDARNLALFEWCAAEEVPIVAHCSRAGFTARGEFKSNSDPVHWRNLFDRYPALAQMRLCLAHAGGAGDWVNWPRPTGLAREALQLAQDFPKVFLDFSHFEEVLSPGFHREMFTRSFAWAQQEFSHATQRAMFGTDWHITNAFASVTGYLAAFQEALSDLKPPVLDQFLWGASDLFLFG